MLNWGKEMLQLQANALNEATARGNNAGNEDKGR